MRAKPVAFTITRSVVPKGILTLPPTGMARSSGGMMALPAAGSVMVAGRSMLLKLNARALPSEARVLNSSAKS